MSDGHPDLEALLAVRSPDDLDDATTPWFAQGPPVTVDVFDTGAWCTSDPPAAPVGSLVNPCSATVTLLEANESRPMQERAAAVPRAAAPDELDWSEEREHQIELTKQWTSLGASWGVAAPSVVRLGCVWTSAGRWHGHGRYLRDAYLYAVADTTGLGQRYGCTGGFLPEPTQDSAGVAELHGWLRLSWSEHGAAPVTYDLGVAVRGDGAGRIWEA